MNFEPKIIGFLCQNSAWLTADFSGMEMRGIPAKFFPIKLPCLCGLDILYPLWAIFSGADGIIIAGCHQGYCKHKTGNQRAKRNVEILKRLSMILGLEDNRIQFASFYPQEIEGFVDTLTTFNENLIKLGYNNLFRSCGQNEQKNNLQSSKAEKKDLINQLKRCSQCYHCMEVCHICICKRCSITSFPNFGMGWLIHVVERCDGCGACIEACPEGIPLFHIVQILKKEISEIPPIHLIFKKEKEV